MAGHFVIKGSELAAPEGLHVVRWDEPGGVGAKLHANLRPRIASVSQLILHRGNESKGRHPTLAHATEATLARRGYSTTLILDVDGTVYQVHDPADVVALHCAHHNRYSDGLDVCGPLSTKRKALEGQEKAILHMAIGRAGDHLRTSRYYAPTPEHRRMVRQAVWTMPPAQAAALALLVPWWCEARGIPLRACSELRTWRRDPTTKAADPVCQVPGIIAHLQVSDPGRRIDGGLPLWQLHQSTAPIAWREHFFSEDARLRGAEEIVMYKPIVGDRVYYYVAGWSQPLAAIVTAVWSDTCVNLRVFAPCGGAAGVVDDVLTDTIDSVEFSAKPEVGSWNWPPRS